MKLLENSPKIAEIESRLAKYTFLSRNSLPGYLDGTIFQALKKTQSRSLAIQSTQTVAATLTSITGTSSCASSPSRPSRSGSRTRSTTTPATTTSNTPSTHRPPPTELPTALASSPPRAIWPTSREAATQDTRKHNTPSISFSNSNPRKWWPSLPNASNTSSTFPFT